MFASEPTEGQGIGVLGALLLNTDDGVETLGRVEGSPLEVRSDWPQLFTELSLSIGVCGALDDETDDGAVDDGGALRELGII